MKKNILLFGALIGAFLLVSCSGGNKKTGCVLCRSGGVGQCQ